MKKCAICNSKKSLDEFPVLTSSLDGRHRCCKECNTERSNQYRKRALKENPDKVKADSRRRFLKQRFGLTVEAYDKMFEAQGWCCAICGSSTNTFVDKNGRPLSFAVDHDHSTGEIRGILCGSCNAGIGLLKDSVDVLAKATEYLKKHKQEN